MDTRDIISIIDYWKNKLNMPLQYIQGEFESIPFFVPFTPLPTNKSFYMIDMLPYTDITSAEKFDNCRFIKKEKFSDAIVGGFNTSDYTLNINRTAILLWRNHADSYKYYSIWLYALCTHIIRNRDKIGLTRTPYFYNRIKQTLDCIKEQAFEDLSIEISERLQYDQKSNRILPDGLLTTDFYQIDETRSDINRQINKILLTEIMCILYKNYMVIF